MNQLMKGISVIICTNNGAFHIPETLRCIAKQEKTSDFNVEVIVIDNASTDGTADVTRKIWRESESPFEIKILFEPKPGKSNALITGFDNAQYEYLLICDDDNRLFPDYFSKAFKMMENDTSIGVLGGQGIPDFETTPPFWFETYKQFFAVGKQLDKSGEVINDYNSIYSAGALLRNSIWITLKKINFKFCLTTLRDKNPISGEDTELFEMISMMGYKLWINNDMKFNHYLPSKRVTWNYLKKFNYGIGRSNIYIYAYIHCRKHDFNPANSLKLPLWIDKYINSVILMKRFVPTIIKSFFSNMEGDENYLLYRGYCGRLYELRKLKKGYKNLFDTILYYKQKLKELN